VITGKGVFDGIPPCVAKRGVGFDVTFITLIAGLGVAIL
jgi:hypothetical protein